MVTTCHQRRFCSVECLTESHRIHLGWMRLETALLSDIEDQLRLRASLLAALAEAQTIRPLDRSRV
jgi:hypothetical protein